MLIIVAIIAVLVFISIPLAGDRLEKARVATDSANERGAYGCAVAQYLVDGTFAGQPVSYFSEAAHTPVGAMADAPVRTMAYAPVRLMADEPVGTMAYAPVRLMADEPVGTMAYARSLYLGQMPAPEAISLTWKEREGGQKSSAEVQAFLDAVAKLPKPSEVMKANSVEIEEKAKAVIDMGEALELQIKEREDVKTALDKARALYQVALNAYKHDPYVKRDSKITSIGGNASGKTERTWDMSTFVDTPTKFQRVSTRTYTGSNNLCQHTMYVMTGKYYNKPRLQSIDDGFVNRTIKEIEDGFTIGVWRNDPNIVQENEGTNDPTNKSNLVGAKCLQWDFTPLKPGKTTAKLMYFVRFDGNSEGLLGKDADPSEYWLTNWWVGVCPICGKRAESRKDTDLWMTYYDTVNITIKARYNLDYDTQGGSAVSATSQDVPAPSADLTAAAAPIRSGYIFKEWNTKADGSGTPYAAGAAVTLSWSEGLGSEANPVSQTLYAIWERDPLSTFTVTYTDGVDGEEVFADVVHGNLQAGVPTPAFRDGGNPTRQDYTFLGWSPVVASTVTGDATYTATWEKNTTTDPMTPPGGGEGDGGGGDGGGSPTTPNPSDIDAWYNGATGKWQLTLGEGENKIRPYGKCKDHPDGILGGRLRGGVLTLVWADKDGNVLPDAPCHVERSTRLFR